MIIESITKTSTYRLKGVCPYCRNDIVVRITDKEIKSGEFLFNCRKCDTEQELKPNIIKQIKNI